MSRIGKIPLACPKEVKLNITPTTVNLEGPKGKLSLTMPYGIKVEQNDKGLCISRVNDTKQIRADHGTVRALLKNMILGVSKGHTKDLEIQGLGFRAQAAGQKLSLSLGFSHPVEYMVPAGIKLASPKPNEIKLEGADKILLGQVAAQIRDIKPPEPYKGKGIRYVGEVVKRKQGKSVTK
ncbi:MAG: 50S ribosomal protein L6 [Candidatus Omnitrophica bacterium]|nr:50S ribosomal protein L6 [Candidatus Omnitrophota bacterium]